MKPPSRLGTGRAMRRDLCTARESCSEGCFDGCRPVPRRKASTRERTPTAASLGRLERVWVRVLMGVRVRVLVGVRVRVKGER